MMDVISIHAPHAGSDLCSYWFRRPSQDFNPRSPCGERLGTPKVRASASDFNPRSPCGERLIKVAVSP